MAETSETNNNRSSKKLNKLRAAVLGANDGIVSVSGVVMGVAGATSDRGVIFTAGLAALVAGALSMAVGEYVSVSSQSDAEKSYIEQEKKSLHDNPREEFEELTQAYVDRGVSRVTAEKVARELSSKNPLKAHLEIEFGLDEDDINSPTEASVASLISFTIGGLIPFLATLLSPDSMRIPITVVAVVIALILTGILSARAGEARARRAVARVIVGGLIAMAITYAVGAIFGTTVQ